VLIRRKRALETAEYTEEPTPSVGEALGPEHAPGEPEADEPDPLTRYTPCVCGHTRLEHMGLRIEVEGRCLECSCEKFTRTKALPQTDAQTLPRLQARIARVQRLIKAAADVHPGPGA
jgi:hypothetical protein